MSYEEFLEYIYQRHSGNVKLGLERMNNILQQMENPHLKLSGIHIAGTNGKGSTAAICESLALQHGLSTGMNTSPHLIDYRERIRVDGKNIALDDLIRIYRKWEKVFEENEASFFEITTALAFYYFLEREVDCAVFEVGLGGRLDGTNPFSSTVSIITTISFDHTKSLGDTLEKIAFEKAGIIKPETPVIIGEMSDEAKKVIKNTAARKNSPIIEFQKDFSVSNITVSEFGTEFDFSFGQIKLNNLKTNLIGDFQAKNVSLALASFITFLEKKNIRLDPRKVIQALLRVNWIGRMQIISQKPLVIIDGAHNEEGVLALTKNIKSLLKKKKIFFVFAILRDKNLDSIVTKICEISNKVYISKNTSQRAAEIDDQIGIVRQTDIPFETAENVVSAANKAISEAGEDDVVIISGSLYTISEVLKDESFIQKIEK